ncbi:MAG: hypothetical protein KBD76_09950 [Bacteriovorax sp.]|nr:hypothetical protein [Bacteriovorax sp.]
MKNSAVLYALVIFFAFSAHAGSLKFKTPPIHAKINSTNLELTDLQTVISCHFNYQGARKQVIRYPQTELIKEEGPFYSLKIKAATLGESLPRLDLLTCAYKLIVIGKNKTTHQPSYGELFLAGKETGHMSDSELQTILDPTQLTKILNERIKDLIISNGKDGGIGEISSLNDKYEEK